MSVEIIQEKIDNATRMADEHYRNYQLFDSRNNLPKASEFLWGTINQLFYSIGLYHNRKLGKYSKIREFLPTLIHLYNDKEIIQEGFESAYILHTNFYHDHLEKDSFEFHKEKVEKLKFKLIKILEKLHARSLLND